MYLNIYIYVRYSLYWKGISQYFLSISYTIGIPLFSTEKQTPKQMWKINHLYSSIFIEKKWNYTSMLVYRRVSNTSVYHVKSFCSRIFHVYFGVEIQVFGNTFHWAWWCVAGMPWFSACTLWFCQNSDWKWPFIVRFPH